MVAADGRAYRFESVLKKVPEGHRWMAMIFLVAAMPNFFAGMHNLGAVYLIYAPDHWCSPPSTDLRLAFTNNWTMSAIKDYAIPAARNSKSKCEIRFTSTMSRIDGVAAAFIVDFLTPINAMLLFGVQMMLAAGLCLSLHETGNKKLPDTEVDVEHFVDLEIDPGEQKNVA